MHQIRPVHAESDEIFDVMGPQVQFLTHPLEPALPYCVIKSILPPGIAVPLHSHPDVETLYVLSGCVQSLVADGGAFVWRDLVPGDSLLIPSSVAHAHRNSTSEPVVALIVTTPTLGQFLLEVGRRVMPGEPYPVTDAAALRHFSQVAARYHHWLAGPEDNEAIGIALPME